MKKIMLHLWNNFIKDSNCFSINYAKTLKIFKISYDLKFIYYFKRFLQTFLKRTILPVQRQSLKVL